MNKKDIKVELRVLEDLLMDNCKKIKGNCNNCDYVISSDLELKYPMCLLNKIREVLL